MYVLFINVFGLSLSFAGESNVLLYIFVETDHQIIRAGHEA